MKHYFTYGGYYISLIKSKWLTIHFCDYRDNIIVKHYFQLEFYSKLWGNKIIRI